MIRTDGNFLFEQWFDFISNFNGDGFSLVELNDKWNLIDTNGKLVSQQWFDSYDNAYDYLLKLQQTLHFMLKWFTLKNKEGGKINYHLLFISILLQLLHLMALQLLSYLLYLDYNLSF